MLAALPLLPSGLSVPHRDTEILDGQQTACIFGGASDTRVGAEALARMAFLAGLGLAVGFQAELQDRLDFLDERGLAAWL